MTKQRTNRVVRNYRRSEYNYLRGTDPKQSDLHKLSDEQRINKLKTLADPDTAPEVKEELAAEIFGKFPLETKNAKLSRADIVKQFLECAAHYPEWLFAPRSKGGPITRKSKTERKDSESFKAKSVAPPTTPSVVTVPVPLMAKRHITLKPELSLRKQIRKWLDTKLPNEQYLQHLETLISEPFDSAECEKSRAVLFPGIPSRSQTTRVAHRPNRTREDVHEIVLEAAHRFGCDYVLREPLRGRAGAKVKAQLLSNLANSTNRVLEQVITNSQLAQPTANPIATQPSPTWLPVMPEDISQDAEQQQPASVAHPQIPIATQNDLGRPVYPLLPGLSKTDSWIVHDTRVKVKQGHSINLSNLALTTWYYRDFYPQYIDLPTEYKFTKFTLYDTSHFNWDAKTSWFSSLAPTDLDKNQFAYSLKLGLKIDAMTGGIEEIQITRGSIADVGMIRNLQLTENEVITGDAAFATEHNQLWCCNRGASFLFRTSINDFNMPVVEEAMKAFKDTPELYMSATYKDLCYAERFSAKVYRDQLLGLESIVEEDELLLNIDLPADQDCLNYINPLQQKLQQRYRSYYTQTNKNGYVTYTLHVRVTGNWHKNVMRLASHSETQSFCDANNTVYQYERGYLYALFRLRAETEFSVTVVGPKEKNYQRAYDALLRLTGYCQELNTGNTKTQAHDKAIADKEIVRTDGGKYIVNRTVGVGKRLNQFRIYISTIPTAEKFDTYTTTGRFRLAEFIYALYKRRWGIETLNKATKKIIRTLNLKSEENAITLLLLVLISVHFNNLSKLRTQLEAKKALSVKQVVEDFSLMSQQRTEDGITYSELREVSLTNCKKFQKQTGVDYPSSHELERNARFVQKYKTIDQYKQWLVEGKIRPKVEPAEHYYKVKTSCRSENQSHEIELITT